MPPLTLSNTSIKVLRHAVSLDEQSVKYKPVLYQRINNADHDFKMPEEAVIEKRARFWAELEFVDVSNRLGKGKEMTGNGGDKGPTLAKEDQSVIKAKHGLGLTAENLDAKKEQIKAVFLERSRPTNVKEVWFAGRHGGVSYDHIPHLNVTLTAVNLYDRCLRRMHSKWSVWQPCRPSTQVDDP